MPQKGFIRKYQSEYADIIQDHLGQTYPHMSKIIYIGDTAENDAAVIRNLQSIYMKVFGYICDPHLNLPTLWFDDMMYSKNWDSILDFLASIKPFLNFDRSTLAIFDIDQTLWAPKGVNDGPIAESRKKAIDSILKRYFSKDNSFLLQAIKAARAIYEKSCDKKYIGLTEDNEDYKALIAVLSAIGIDRECIDNPSQSPMSRYDSPDDLDWWAESTLDRITREGSIYDFLHRVMFLVIICDSTDYPGKFGLNLDLVRQDIQDFGIKFNNGVPAPFSAFRSEELSMCRILAKNDEVKDAITLNRVVFDIAETLDSLGVPILALSDRPDEATYDDTTSLLDEPMIIYGPNYRDEIRKLILN
jgi:hypothetical protein